MGNSLVEERRKFDKMSQKFQEDHDKLKDELNGELTRLRADYDEKIEDYEQRLEKALADKHEKMQALESSLQDSLRTKRQEYDSIKDKHDEAISKVTDLERRLNNQTEEVLRLTAELDSYEYAE